MSRISVDDDPPPYTPTTKSPSSPSTAQSHAASHALPFDSGSSSMAPTERQLEYPTPVSLDKSHQSKGLGFGPPSTSLDGSVPHSYLSPVPERLRAIRSRDSFSSIPPDSDYVLNHIPGRHYSPNLLYCPHCHRMIEPIRKGRPSASTHLKALALFFTTVCGVALPYIYHWSYDLNQCCEFCGEVVQRRRH
ncbi:hypothetical protein BGZ61DRAFT_451852 [Ilyonectria robusta]|uniref:uncharacterized protein n=1 Tax=Ilyonectria robusta TaxID=1079257 RepID=UPI001E8EE90A|nr:uncharacterized protein BGZ61DRAFT_451852 [Ilyonectria robusta]KAH8694381.1 hypothetical protein BGZ61DRAFT_451852 [Ilyonectria robusta]